MTDIDLSSLSKSELQKLMRKSKQRLHRLKTTADRPELKSSDIRVGAIADQVRALSEELGLKRRDVFVAVAGNMRVAVGPGGDKSAQQRAETTVSSEMLGAQGPAQSKRAPAASQTKAKSPSSGPGKSAKSAATGKGKTAKTTSTKTKPAGKKGAQKAKRGGKKQAG